MLRLPALLGLLWLAPAAAAPGVIYGVVETEDGRTLAGVISWDDEEVYWVQHFNGRRLEPVDLSAFDEETRNAILDQQPGPQIDFNGMTVELVKWFSDPEMRPTDFAVEFGAIERLAIEDGRVSVLLRDGSRIETSGGGNDIGADLTVLSSDGSERTVDWDDVRSVVFETMPEDHPRPPPQLYGVVETGFGSFSGVIAWDADERFATEELDGEIDGQERVVEFGDIVAIENLGNESGVRLVDGSELVLGGTNDVNDENRGIVVVNPAFGRMVVDWSDFRRITFQPLPDGLLPGREAWTEVGVLRGTVLAGDQRRSGELLYDVDERCFCDTLEGRIGRSRVSIPFHRVARIERQDNRVTVTLRDGLELELTGDRDVSDSNNGVVLLEGGARRYLRWQEVNRIEFDG